MMIVAVVRLLIVSQLTLAPIEALLHDTFTFGATDRANRVFGPHDWKEVQCHDVETCPGWPTNWENFHDFIPYDGSSNMCNDCSTKTGGICRFHQQSPINLHRNITAKRECKDRHRMNYVAGNCDFDDMNFQILPHVLRVYQPEYCQIEPNIDYSMGFPDPWMLKFTDITVPSHHTIEGHQFSAEVFLSHVYSAEKENKLIGNVAVLLEAGTEADRYDFLELYIKRFRDEKEKISNICASQSPTSSPSSDHRRAAQLNDPMLEHGNNKYFNRGIQVNHTELRESPSWNDRKKTTQYRGLEEIISEIDHVNDPPDYVGVFHPYMWVKDVGTEYYFRYNGSTPEPPCFEGVHWRVLRRPIIVAPSQIAELHELIATRQDPATCTFENAGRPREDDPAMVDINRPLQTLRNAHRLVYCECVDWKSPKKADKNLCRATFDERGVSDRSWPTRTPSETPTQFPSFSTYPSERPDRSEKPSQASFTSPSQYPTMSSEVSESPPFGRPPSSVAPSGNPSPIVPSFSPSSYPIYTAHPSNSPSATPTSSQSQYPTMSSEASESPPFDTPPFSVVKSENPSPVPSSLPSSYPSITAHLSKSPSATPTYSKSQYPTMSSEASESPPLGTPSENIDIYPSPKSSTSRHPYRSASSQPHSKKSGSQASRSTFESLRGSSDHSSSANDHFHRKVSFLSILLPTLIFCCLWNELNL